MSLQLSLGKGGDTLYPGTELGPNQFEEPEVIIINTSLPQTDLFVFKHSLTVPGFKLLSNSTIHSS